MSHDGFRRVGAGHYLHTDSGITVTRRLTVRDSGGRRKVDVDWVVKLPNGEQYGKPTMRLARLSAPTWKVGGSA